MEISFHLFLMLWTRYESSWFFCWNSCDCCPLIFTFFYKMVQLIVGVIMFPLFFFGSNPDSLSSQISCFEGWKREKSYPVWITNDEYNRVSCRLSGECVELEVYMSCVFQSIFISSCGFFLQLLQYLHSENKLSSRFPIGLEEQIKKWDADKIRRFHERWYFPANATLYIVGDIDNITKTVYQIEVCFLYWIY